MPSASAAGPRLLSAEDSVRGLDCGVEDLNRYLHRFALPNQQANAGRTYIALAAEGVAGYYTFAYGSVEHDEAPERLRKGLARHPIPVMVLARRAVARARQGQHLGARLLFDALRRTLLAAQIAGLRAVIVEAKDERASTFYRHFGFEPCTRNPRKLYLLTRELAAMIGSHESA